MKTDFVFVNEIMSQLKTRLTNEINTIIDAVSTEDIPLSEITNIHMGFFDPVNYGNTPSIFSTFDMMGLENGEDDTYSNYGSSIYINLNIVNGMTSSDRDLFVSQTYGYIKALIIFINQHLDDYSFASETPVDVFDALGADDSKMWAEIRIKVDLDIPY